ncbi:hypothetical protein BSY238_1759 [Methyloversatilis sp. RAC08]|uniref:hypothetical protein n=1 Tax=Methyloversatilis sp. RAC08 TaxID=1842540 RepID=UPI00083E0044|nr:hypothetical protein [Methyloversatilis sp. RAC08]AOF82481.1 hypothetical protein BSY238_1759 [Methyloversatilis sp. RAC08]
MKTSNMIVAGFTAFALSGYALAQSDPAKAAGASGEVSSPLIADPATTQVPASPSHPAIDGAQKNLTTSPDAVRGSTAQPRSAAQERMNNTSADERLRMNSSNAASQDSMNEARKLSDEGATAAGDSTPTTRAARADRN